MGRLGWLCFTVLALGSAHAQKKIPFDPDSVVIGSAAELWKQRSAAAKAAYLDGLCEGYSGSKETAYVGSMRCRGELDMHRTNKWRVCGLKALDESKAVAVIDEFYRDAKHSDIPIWAAMAAYNDKTCGESNVTPRLPGIQAHMKCLRVHSNMHGASKAAQEAQLAECKRLSA